MHDPVFAAMIAAFATLMTLACNSWLTMHKEKENRKYQLLQRRLDEFYGPMLNLVVELRLREQHYVELLGKITGKQISLQTTRDSDSKDKAMEAWKNTHEQRKSRWRDIDMSLYGEIHALFKAKQYLAEPSTQAFYKRLINLLELMEMIKNDYVQSMPFEIMMQYNDSQFLREFQNDLESHREALLLNITGSKTSEQGVLDGVKSFSQWSFVQKSLMSH